MDARGDSHYLKHRYAGVSRGVQNSSVALESDLLPTKMSGSRTPYKRDNNSSTAMQGSGHGLNVFLLIIALLLGAGAGYYYYEKKFEKHELSLLLNLHHAQEAQQSLKSKVESLESLNKKLSRERADVKYELENVEKQLKQRMEREQSVSQLSEIERHEKLQLERKVRDAVHYAAQMQEAVQKMSRERLLEKFGPGPHRMEIELAYPPESNMHNDVGGETVLVELAPEEYMPHTVLTFLEQVDRKLWDGASFHRNANHVIQAGPVANFLTPVNVNLSQKFKESGYANVLFQEYSHHFPHAKFTLGFAGRPGGPDFYISTMNNAQFHGPGGQQEDADPCFAKVIGGFDALDRLQRTEVEVGSYQRIKNYVAIKQIRILTKVK